MAAGRGRGASLARVVHDAVVTLTSAGLPQDVARIDATLLARWCLRWDAATWLARSVETPPRGFAGRFAAALIRRQQREPISHIIGEREFYGRVFRVTPDVLTPRPETELVVDEALAALRAPDRRGRAVLAADVGTGSGCLAVTLASEVSRERDGPIRVVATDTSEAALEVAADNAARHGVAPTIHFARADLLGAIGEPLDLVVANPPYVATTTRAELAPEVRREPDRALFGGPDGLAVIRRLVRAVPRALAPGGHLVMEMGHDQHAAVVDLLRAEPALSLVRVARDLQQLPRVAVVRRVERL